MAELRPSCEKGFALLGDRVVLDDYIIKGLGMSSHVSATGHLKDPVPLIEKSRASCPSGRFPLFIHQVITALIKL